MAWNGHLATANDTCQFGGTGSRARLKAVVVNKAVATAVVTLYNGTSTSGDVVAVIDAGTAPVSLAYWNLPFPNGIFAKLTTANADVTVVAE